MTGMKKGAGENPFADSEEEENEERPQERRSDVEMDEGTSDGERTDIGMESSGSKTRGRVTEMQIPYKYRRDGVKDGRDRVPLFLQEETKRAEREAQRELESRFDDSVSMTDLREALVKVGLSDLDRVEEVLEDWGYGMEFD